MLTTAVAVTAAPSARADCPDLQVFHAAGKPCSVHPYFVDSSPHAIGTSESGLASVGNALAIYLPKYVKNVRVVPINYNTDPEYVVSVEQGTEEMENDVTAFAVCVFPERCLDLIEVFANATVHVLTPALLSRDIRRQV